MQGGARAAGSARSCDELRRTLRRPVAAGWFSGVGPRELEVACDRYKCYPILVCAERDFRRLRICRGTPLKTPHLALNGECFQFTLAQNSPDFLVSRQPFGARPFGGLSTAQPQVYGLHCLSSVQVLPRVGLLEFLELLAPTPTTPRGARARGRPRIIGRLSVTGCSGPWAPRPADVACRVATQPCVRQFCRLLRSAVPNSLKNKPPHRSDA